MRQSTVFSVLLVVVCLAVPVFAVVGELPYDCPYDSRYVSNPFSAYGTIYGTCQVGIGALGVGEAVDVAVHIPWKAAPEWVDPLNTNNRFPAITKPCFPGQIQELRVSAKGRHWRAVLGRACGWPVGNVQKGVLREERV